jgi:hypothetical protein
MLLALCSALLLAPGLVGCQNPGRLMSATNPLPPQHTVLDPDALLMPTGSPFGRAINGVSFQQEALLTHAGFQYAAWYTRDQNTVALARRTVRGIEAGPWRVLRLADSTLVNGGPPGPGTGYRKWNTHNVVSLGICPQDGTLHMFFDMHASRLRYRRSVVGLASAGEADWSAEAFLPEQNWLDSPQAAVPSMTYPRMASAPDGSLLLLYRVSGSGNGDLVLRRYREGAWSTPTVVVGRAGEFTDRFGTSPHRNAYENGLSVGADGSLHLSWTWREFARPVANHGIGYARSDDGGTVWRAADGTVVADTAAGERITVATEAAWLNRTDRSLAAINQQAQLVDRAGRFHVVMSHRRDDRPFEEGQGFWPRGVQSYFHYVLDPATRGWRRNELPGAVGSRPKLGEDARGNLYLVYREQGALTVQRATPAKEFADWQVIASEPGPYTGEPLLDPIRLREDGVLSVLAQRDGPASPEPMGTPLTVIDLDVRNP